MQRELAMDLIKVMRNGNGINKVIMYILPSKLQERKILFEATRTCIWLKLDVCSMRVRFATQQRDTSGLINHEVKYFAKANSAFAIFLHRRDGRFIAYQFKEALSRGSCCFRSILC